MNYFRFCVCGFNYPIKILYPCVTVDARPPGSHSTDSHVLWWPMVTVRDNWTNYDTNLLLTQISFNQNAH